MTTLYIALNGDNVGQKIGQAIANDDHDGLQAASQSISSSHGMIEEWVESNGGKVITSSGDEGIYQIPSEAADSLEQIRQQYNEMSGHTITIGVGASMSEASKALIYGKLNNKDQITQYAPEMEEALANEHYSGEEGEEGEEEIPAEGELPSEDEVGENIESEAIEEQGGAAEDTDGYADHDPAVEQEFADEAPEGDPASEMEDEEGAPPVGEELSDEDIIDEAPGGESPPIEGEEDPEMPEGEAPPEMEDEIEDATEQGIDGENFEGEDEGELPTGEEGEDADAPPVEAEEGEGEDHGEILENMIYGHMNEEEGAEPPMPGEEGMEEEAPMEEGVEDPMAAAAEEDEVPPEMQEEGMEGEEGDDEELKSDIAQALLAFKQDKHILEGVRETNPALYEATITMLRVMIEMGKKLGYAPEQDAGYMEAEAEMNEGFPQKEEAVAVDEEEDAEKKRQGKPLA